LEAQLKLDIGIVVDVDKEKAKEEVIKHKKILQIYN